MRRKVSIITALALAFVTLFPVTAFAAGSDVAVIASSKGAATLSGLKLSDVKKYDKPLPTNGKKKTQRQIEKMLGGIPEKISGKGTTEYRYCLRFYRQNDAPRGEYSEVTKEKYWTSLVFQNGHQAEYYEMKCLKNDPRSTYNGVELKVNKTLCYLYVPCKKNGNRYTWIKGEKTGLLEKEKYLNQSLDWFGNVNAKKYKLYKDETVLGQKCMVFSFEVGSATYFQWISQKTQMLVKFVGTNKNSTWTGVYFDKKKVTKKKTFYKKPGDVKFKIVTNNASE